MSAIPHIAIVGSGASGTLLAIQLLRQATQPLRVLLFERMSETGRGVAYGTEFAGHVLNVPAARMSAFPDQPEHFLEWARAQAGAPEFPATVAAGDFLPRRVFGHYLAEALANAKRTALEDVDLIEVKGEVIDVEDETGEKRLRCGDGRSFAADEVILALGNLPGEYPIRRSLPFYHSQRYVHVPWRPGTLAGIPPSADVLLVGAGLTSIDLVLQLAASGHRGTIHALSRRGLLPQSHRASAPYRDFLAENELPHTVRALLRCLRCEVAHAQRGGIDWRPVLDAIRPHSQALWRGFSWEERARFMRHVRPFWDVHRHRLAPQVAAQIESLREGGRLKFHAGRLEKLLELPDGAVAVFRERNTKKVRTLQVAKVINCTGPRTDYSKYQHPLLVNLLARGLIDHDPLALGLRATPEGEVLSHRGGPVGWLHTLGAPLKGELWECTAIPEIRTQAARLAEKLVAKAARAIASGERAMR
jgi:uncharacterized NAD(P)/FAD-binding protein YdhS